MKFFGFFFILFTLVSFYFLARLSSAEFRVPSAIARDGRLYIRKDTKLISIDGSTLEVELPGRNKLYLSSSQSGPDEAWSKDFGSGIQ